MTLPAELEGWAAAWREAEGPNGPSARLKRRWIDSKEHGRHLAVTANGDERVWIDAIDALEFAEELTPPGYVLSFGRITIDHKRSHTRTSWRAVWITEAESQRRMARRQQGQKGSHANRGNMPQ